MDANIEIIIGTYEEFLLGYKLELQDSKPTLKQSFADKSHSGSIKCVAAQGRWIATGGVDDRIFVYDMNIRKQCHIDLSHSGTINALAFTPDETHLLSGGSDGVLLATRVKSWRPNANWQKAHDGKAITHISCHPSSKLALSLGGDVVLRTWNLVKGRVAYKTNLKSRNTLGTAPDCLAWSVQGDYFTLCGPRCIEIWSIKSADVVRTENTLAKPICLTWLSNEICLVGLEDGILLWLSVDAAEKSKSFEAHTARVKAICCYSHYLVTASSSGEIKLWNVKLDNRKLEEIALTNIGCRPICIAILDLNKIHVHSAVESCNKIDEKPPSTLTLKLPMKPLQDAAVTIEYDNQEDNEKNQILFETANTNEENNVASYINDTSEDNIGKRKHFMKDADISAEDITNGINRKSKKKIRSNSGKANLISGKQQQNDANLPKKPKLHKQQSNKKKS